MAAAKSEGRVYLNIDFTLFGAIPAGVDIEAAHLHGSDGALVVFDPVFVALLFLCDRYIDLLAKNFGKFIYILAQLRYHLVQRLFAAQYQRALVLFDTVVEVIEQEVLYRFDMARRRDAHLVIKLLHAAPRTSRKASSRSIVPS